MNVFCKHRHGFVASSVFKKQCFLGCVFYLSPVHAAHVGSPQSRRFARPLSPKVKKPPNGIFHSGTIGDIFMAGHEDRFLLPLSVRSLKGWQPWRTREGPQKIERAGKYKQNCRRRPPERTKTTCKAQIGLSTTPFLCVQLCGVKSSIVIIVSQGDTFVSSGKLSLIGDSGLAACQYVAWENCQSDCGRKTFFKPLGI